MAKVNELIFDVREAVKEFTDDTEIDNRYIIYLYNIKRAKYLRQELNNYQRSTDNSIKQTLCLGVSEVSADECDVDFKCETLLRTDQVIPTPLELHTKVAITKIKPTLRLSVPFNFITKDKAAFLGGAIFNSVYSFLDDDGYVYIVKPEGVDYKLLDCITITGIFENPLDLADYQNCCSCDASTAVCFDELTSDYPLTPHLIDLIREEIVRDILRTKQIPEDKINNSID